MNQLLSDPVFQSAVAPFAAALIAGALLNLAGWYWPGLSVTAGFYLSAWLAVGLDLFPLTSTHKIILLGGVATLVGIALDAYKGPRRYLPALLFAGGAAAAVWVLWPVLVRKGGSQAWELALGCGLYAGWVLACGSGLRSRPLPAGAMALALATGTGVSAVFGSAVLLGQMGLSMAAAAGAYLLLGVILRGQNAGSILVTPVALLCGLLGVSGVVYAKVPWSALPVLAFIPLLAYLPLREDKPLWLRASMLLLIVLPVAGAAILVTRRITGPLPPL
jgi:hypothetical protein